MSSQKHILTPEQISLSEERKKKKAGAALKAPPSQKIVEAVKILDRRWLTLPVLSEETMANSIVVMTWNVSGNFPVASPILLNQHQMLAQCLVRKKISFRFRFHP